MNLKRHIPPKSKTAMLLVAGLFLLQFLPYLLLGEGSYVRIHDNLEAEWLWYHLLVETGAAFDYSEGAVVAPVMNGLIRPAFHTALNFNVFWLSIFGTFWGYVANYCFVHLVGFVGMFLLLRKHFLTEKNHLYIVLGVALCFAWVPYFTALGLSVAGQPLVVYAFLNILRRNKEVGDTDERSPTFLSAFTWLKDWLIIAIFPFYASIVWAGPPVIGLLVLIGIAHYFGALTERSRSRSTANSQASQQPTAKRPNSQKPIAKGLAAILLMGLLFLIANFQLVGLMLDPAGFVSHREEYDYFYDKDLSLLSSIGEAALMFLISHYHVGIFVGIPILLMAVMSFYHKGDSFWIKASLSLIVVVCLFYGFYNWVVYLLGDLPLVSTFKFERVSVLLPFLWCFLMAISLKKINQQRVYSSLVLLLMGVQFIMIVLSNDEFLHNTRELTGQATKPSYREYMANNLFNKIKKHINRPTADYRVMSLGLNPGIAQMNGFYSLDGLQAIYDLNYKKKFRKIIRKELDKDATLKNYFDGWGNRCYLFSAELGKEDKAFLIGKKQAKHVQQLAIDTEAFRKLGGEYLISALPIDNYQALDLELVKTFEDSVAYWKIYLYQARSKSLLSLRR